MRKAIWGVCIAMVVSSIASAQSLTVTGVARYSFSVPTSTASELSGISYVSGNQFYAISDNDAKLYSVRITVDPNTGGITNLSIEASPLALRTASGTAYAST